MLAELSVLAPSGVEQVEEEDLVEFAIYGAEGELPDLGSLDASIGSGTVEVIATEVADDWADRWRDFHRPVSVIGPSGEGPAWVGPPWCEAPDRMPAIVVDPGRAFGTGSHPTTRLCLVHLLGLSGRGLARGGLTDVGTGSGVLAIAAAMLGWGPVRSFDSEMAAVDQALSNARLNKVEIEVSRADLRDGLPTLEDTVVANLTAPLLLELADRIDPGKIPARLVCSGLLEGDREKVAGAFERIGLALTGSASDEGWAGLLLEAE